MRLLPCVALLACACCSRNPGPPPSPPPGSVRVACRTRLADHCATHPCDRTLDAMKQDRRICPATITACGDVTLVSQNRADASVRWYHQAGQLTAIVNELAPGPRYMCVAGPEVFEIPACTPSSQSLPACDP